MPSPQLIVAVKLSGRGLTTAEVNEAMVKVDGPRLVSTAVSG